MRPHVDALTRQGIAARAIDLPKSNATRAMAAFRDAAKDDLAHTVIGGHSYGGRVASLLAAEEDVAGLILLSYPLHRPGHPEQLRTEHWPRIRCPVLVLSGEADPFARMALLRQSVELLGNAELVTYPGIGHGLLPVLEDAMRRAANFVRERTGS
jgi:predicted alpha/beta-hydrolase family hydrolase